MAKNTKRETVVVKVSGMAFDVTKAADRIHRRNRAGLRTFLSAANTEGKATATTVARMAEYAVRAYVLGGKPTERNLNDVGAALSFLSAAAEAAAAAGQDGPFPHVKPASVRSYASHINTIIKTEGHGLPWIVRTLRMDANGNLPADLRPEEGAAIRREYDYLKAEEKRVKEEQAAAALKAGGAEKAGGGDENPTERTDAGGDVIDATGALKGLSPSEVLTAVRGALSSKGWRTFLRLTMAAAGASEADRQVIVAAIRDGQTSDADGDDGATVATDHGGGHYTLPDGTKVRGKANLPAGCMVVKAA